MKMNLINRLALGLVLVGALNWGSIGIFQFDLVAFIGGGQNGVISRIIYIVVALAAIWCISLLFRDTDDTVVKDRNLVNS